MGNLLSAMQKVKQTDRPFDISPELEEYIQWRERASQKKGESHQALRSWRRAIERREALERGELRL